MEEVRLYEMYLTEAIEERKTDLLNRNNEYNSSNLVPSKNNFLLVGSINRCLYPFKKK